MAITKHKRYLFVLLGCALVWQAFVYVGLQLGHQNSIYVDCSTYLKSAQMLVYDMTPHQWRPLGMAIYAAIPGVFGQDYMSVFTYAKPINTVIWLIGVLLFYLTLTFYTSAKTAFVTALVYVSCVGVLILNNLLLSEIPWITIMLLGIYGITRFKFKQQQLWLAIGISAILLSVLIRPISKFIIILFISIYWREVLTVLKSRFKLLLVGASFLLLIQCGLMKQTYGDFTVSYIDYYTLHHYVTEQAAFQQSEMTDYNAFSKVWMEEYFSTPYPDRKAFAKESFIKEAIENPNGVITVYGRHQLENLTAPSLYVIDAENHMDTSYFPFLKKIFLLSSHLQNTGFTVLGILAIVCVVLILWKKFKFREHKMLLFLCGMLLYTIGVIGISAEQYDRLNVTNYPFILILIILLLSIQKQKEYTG